jgi:hypothetical protein
VIKREWLTAAERTVLDEALITYKYQLDRIATRSSKTEAVDDARWRTHVVEKLRDDVLG